eukprot:1267008-Rhodomonas_salina.1
MLKLVVEIASPPVRSPISLRECYAMHSTDILYITTHLLRDFRYLARLWCYQKKGSLPTVKRRIDVACPLSCYALSGTDINPMMLCALRY